MCRKPVTDSIKKDINELKGRVQYYEGKSIIGNNKIQPQATIVFMIMEQIFNKEQQEKAQFILNHPLAKLSDLRSNEIKDLATV